MAYDEELAERIRELVGSEYGISERRMFGGLAFCVNGSMAVAVTSRGGLMVRLPADEVEQALEQPNVEPMVMKDKPVKGWIRVVPAGCEGPALEEWVDRGMEHARTLDPS